MNFPPIPESPLRRVPLAVRRSAAALVVAALTFAGVSDGLAGEGWVAVGLIGLIVGLTASHVSGSALSAAVAGGLVVLVGGLGLESASLADVGDVSLGALASAAFGAVGAQLERRGRLLAYALLWLTVAVVLVTGFTTALTISRDQQLAERRLSAPATGSQATDGTRHVDVVQRVAQGQGYYEAWRDAFVAYNDGIPPNAVTDVRLPLLLAALARLPKAPASAAWLLLAIAMAGSVAAAFIANRSVPLPLTLPAVVAILAVSMTAVLTPTFLYHEVWSGLLLLFSAVCFSKAVSGSRAERWMLLSALFAVVAFMVRALAAPMLFAGLAASALGPKEHRRTAVRIWGVALGIGVVTYAVHAAQSMRIIEKTSVGYESWTSQAGLPAVWACIQFNGSPFASELVPAVLVALGILGILVQRDVRMRVLGIVAVILPLASLIFVAPVGREVDGTQAGYWGAMVLPLAFAFSPSGIAWLLGLDRRPPVTANRPLADSASRG